MSTSRGASALRALKPAEPAPAQLPVVPVIDPNAWYRIHQLAKTLGLKASSIPREIREGRLAYSKVCGTVYISGANVVAWLKAAEKRKRRGAEDGQ